MGDEDYISSSFIKDQNRAYRRRSLESEIRSDKLEVFALLVLMSGCLVDAVFGIMIRSIYQTTVWLIPVVCLGYRIVVLLRRIKKSKRGIENLAMQALEDF
jgi:F0F1-type ATP synthase assembly protein I